MFPFEENLEDYFFIYLLNTPAIRYRKTVTF